MCASSLGTIAGIEPEHKDKRAIRARPGPARSALAPHERIEALCDPGSVRAIRAGYAASPSGARAIREGVILAAGRIAGRPVYCYAQDRSVGGGALGEEQAAQILHVMRLAGERGCPIVGFVDSGGARIQEGPRALGAYGRIFRMNVALSRRVPQISVIGGAAAGGACYSPALTDFVVMTAEATMFLTGPGVVREVTGEDVSSQEPRRSASPDPQWRMRSPRPRRHRGSWDRARSIGVPAAEHERGPDPDKAPRSARRRSGGLRSARALAGL